MNLLLRTRRSEPLAQEAVHKVIRLDGAGPEVQALDTCRHLVVFNRSVPATAAQDTPSRDHACP